jgi:hypothetical protein
MTSFVAVASGVVGIERSRLVRQTPYPPCPLHLWTIESSTVGTGAAVEVCMGEVATEERTPRSYINSVVFYLSSNDSPMIIPAYRSIMQTKSTVEVHGNLFRIPSTTCSQPSPPFVSAQSRWPSDTIRGFISSILGH